jgi:flavin reductase (DIM6/NTAB) family NADH-FMN oxidoreductase RutF
MKRIQASGGTGGSRNESALLERPKIAELQQQIREAHRAFPTGVTIVTTQVDGRPVGLAVNAFSSVSMDPPMVLVCVNSSSQSHSFLRDSRHLGISILSRDQGAVAMNFAKSGGDKFDQVEWHLGSLGVPLIDGAAAGFEVELYQQVVAGTHTVFLCRVVGVETSSRPPLVYSAGGFYDGARLVEVAS